MNTIPTYQDFTPTPEQSAVLKELSRFISDTDERQVMILKGAAGTGKTTIMKALASIVKKQGQSCRFAAPTGRAAKVLYSKLEGYEVSTIHSMIYSTHKTEDGLIECSLKTFEREGKCIFVIDESSMISDYHVRQGIFQTDDALLSDLYRYIITQHPSNKILFVGDPYQLPPVVPDYIPSISPALESAYLVKKFGVKVDTLELTTIMRQEEGNLVLSLASTIRSQIQKGNSMYAEYPLRYSSWLAASNEYMNQFSTHNLQKVMIICHLNKDVNWWNTYIRLKRFGGDAAILEKEEVVMVHSTNWTDDGILFNGELGIVKDVDLNPKNIGGLHFSDCTIEFSNSKYTKLATKKFCWEVLMSERGNLTVQQEKNLYHAVMESNPVFRVSKNELDDPYLSALKLRYGYAMTCHKAQGGEWDTIYIHPNLQSLRSDRAKWLYTAYTRASKKLYSWAS